MKNLLLSLAVLSCASLVANKEEVRRLHDGIKAREASVNQMHAQNAEDRERICHLESSMAVANAEERERADGRYSKPAPITRHATGATTTRAAGYRTTAARY